MTRGWRTPGAAARLWFLASLSAPAAFGAQDPFLILSQPVWTNNQLQFSLTGESGVTYVIEGSSNLQTWTPVATNNDPGIARVVVLGPTGDAGYFRAARGPLPLFGGAMITKLNIDLKGNSTTVDSYDSS